MRLAVGARRNDRLPDRVEVAGVVGLDPEVGRQRVGVKLGEQVGALFLAEVGAQFPQRLPLGDQFDRLDVGDPFELPFERGRFRFRGLVV